jgi:hypothetical protein
MLFLDLSIRSSFPLPPIFCLIVLTTAICLIFSQHKMIQCPEAHLFCSSCMTAYASGLLGAHNANIVCMDQSGCKLAFPLSELQRFLTPKLMELYHRVQQTKEIEAAGLENLEECPFCEYKVVIENEHEKLFRCENSDCGAVTCRGCKKPVSGQSVAEKRTVLMDMSRITCPRVAKVGWLSRRFFLLLIGCRGGGRQAS